MTTHAPSRWPRLRTAFALLVLLTAVLAVGACNNKTEAQQAAEALQRGLQAHQAGNLVEAEKQYIEAIRHDPQSKYPYFDLGLVYQTQGRVQDAEANYRVAIGIDPDFTSALFNLAILRTAAGASQEAVDLYRHVIKVDPNSAGAHFNLGLLLRALGQTAEGDKEVQAAIALDASYKDPARASSGPQASPATQPSSSP